MSFFSAISEQLILSAVLVFARIGACLMVMPGISGARIPVRMRLFLAISLSLIMLPVVGPHLSGIVRNMTLAGLLPGIASELLVGASFGFMAQVFYWILQFMANVIAMAMGYTGQPGMSVVESMPESSVANLIEVAALMIFFASNMHLMLLRGLIASYEVLPASLIIQPQAALIDVVEALSRSFLIELRIAAPFVLYTILVNFAAGLVNRLTPTIPVYFVSLPFVISGGLVLLFLLASEMLHFFAGELLSWINQGP